MANIGELFDIKQAHLVGKIVLAPVSKGRIVEIKMPEDDSIVTVTADDLADRNIKIFENFIPVLANGFINYLGQPVMAVFGPDSESVDIFCSAVEFVVDSESEDILSVMEKPLPPFTWTSGNVAKFFVPEAKVIESEFTVASQCENLNSDERILACFSEDLCHVKLASQWPVNVRESVAAVLGLSRSQIRVYSNNFRADFDQLLYMPSAYAAVAAAAAKKAGCLVEIFVPASAWQPETNFRRSTVVNSDGKPTAEKIFVDCDFGAFPLFAEEACYSLLSGLIPPYDVNAVEVVININRSTKAPASFFGDLGYSTAVAFTEHHFTKVAQTLGLSPYEWKSNNLNKISLLSEKVRRCMTYDALKECLDLCAQESWFGRNYSANSQSKFTNQSVSPIIGNSKGIGIACAHGVGGFSESYPYGRQQHLTLSVTEDKRVYVTIGFHIAEDTKNIYRDIIQDGLDVDRNDIIFSDINAENVRDFGPNVLSRSICVVPKLLENGCTQISKRLRTGTKLPVVQQMFYNFEEDRPFFDANTFGSVAVSLHMDPVKVVPVIDNITARLRFGKVYNTTILARRIRQTICTTIAHLCPSIDNNYTIDLQVKSNPHLPAGSCSSMLRGITAAAFASAVSQAIGHEVHSFPISDQDFISIIQSKSPVKENSDEA